MQTTLLLPLLQQLSNKEIKDFGVFLRSPFFNKRTEVVALFDVLIQALRRSSEVPGKEACFYQITAGTQAYDDQQMRLWISYLFKLTEQFLVHQSYARDETQLKTRLARVYRERGLPKHFNRQLKDLKRLRDKAPFRHADYYAEEYRIQVEQYRFLTSTRRTGTLNLQELGDNLDIQYISQKLRQACLALSHQTVYKTEYRYGMINEILHYVEQRDWQEVPAISVYYHGYRTLSAAVEETPFREFKEAIYRHGPAFPDNELGDLYLLAINYCIRKYNGGEATYLKDEFELYQKGLEQDLFLKNNTLSRFTYRNVVTIGLVLREFEWVEAFIRDYQDQLDRKYQESMFSFCSALLEYSRQNYGEALQLLQRSDYKDLLLNLAAKTLILKIYFELDEFDALSAHLAAMRNFIRRKKIMGYHREHYSNLVRFTRKMMDLNPYVTQERNQLRKEIQETQALAEKAWLLERLEA